MVAHGRRAGRIAAVALLIAVAGAPCIAVGLVAIFVVVAVGVPIAIIVPIAIVVPIATVVGATLPAAIVVATAAITA